MTKDEAKYLAECVKRVDIVWATPPKGFNPMRVERVGYRTLNGKQVPFAYFEAGYTSLFEPNVELEDFVENTTRLPIGFPANQLF